MYQLNRMHEIDLMGDSNRNNIQLQFIEFLRNKNVYFIIFSVSLSQSTNKRKKIS